LISKLFISSCRRHNTVAIQNLFGKHLQKKRTIQLFSKKNNKAGEVEQQRLKSGQFFTTLCEEVTISRVQFSKN